MLTELKEGRKTRREWSLLLRRETCVFFFFQNGRNGNLLKISYGVGGGFLV